MKKILSIVIIILAFMMIFVMNHNRNFSEKTGKTDSEQEPVEIIDFHGMTKSEIEDWLHKKGMKNIEFRIPIEGKSEFVRSIPETGKIVKNGEPIIIIFEVVNSSEITMPDFSNSGIEEIETWAAENGIKIRYEYVEENESDIQINIQPGTMISPGDTIVITVEGDADLETEMRNGEKEEDYENEPDIPSGKDENETDRL